MRLLDKNGLVIDHEVVEQHEWKLAKQYVKPTDCVLELGARYGTTSVVVGQILNDKNKLVCVEPDNSVWRALEQNREYNNCSFRIIKGSISKKSQKFFNAEYGSFTLDDDQGETNSYDLFELQKVLGFTFNVLIADCEGCLCTLIRDFPTFFNQLSLVIFEADGLNLTKCNPEIVKNYLLNNGFKPQVEGLHNVYTK